MTRAIVLVIAVVSVGYAITMFLRRRWDFADPDNHIGEMIFIGLVLGCIAVVWIGALTTL